METTKITNCCDVCKKSIAVNPEHFEGNVVRDEHVVRCVLYDMFTLALALQTLEQTTWPHDLCYELFSRSDPQYEQGRFDPGEVVKIAALVKTRILYDFLYTENSGDDFQAAAVPLHLRNGKSAQDFSAYGVTQTDFKNKSEVDQLANEHVFTKQAISKYVAHLLEERILKPKCIPQVKFAEGRKETIKVATLILKDTTTFIEKVVNHPEFPGLTDWGKGYWNAYQEVMRRIT